MFKTLQPTQSADVQKASRRCGGALIMAVFGTLWLLLAAYALHRFNSIHIAPIVAGLFLFVLISLRLEKQAGALGSPPPETYESKQQRRLFAIVNAVQGIAIFLDFFILERTRLAQFAVPVAVVIVGLHMFFLPAVNRHRSTLIIGCLLIAAAILCSLLLRGDRRIAATALCAGLILWSNGAWALRTANLLLSRENA